MKQDLEELVTIPGVTGGYALHLKQGIGANLLPDSFQKEKLTEVSRQLLKIFSASRMNFKTMKDLSLHYDGLVLYLRQVAEQLFLVAICEPTVNTNVLSMSVSLAVEEMGHLEEAQAEPELAVPKPAEVPKSAPTLTPDRVRETGPLVADLETVEEALAGVMGPMSEMILDEAIDEWFQTVKASYDTLPVLIRILSREIGDAEKVVSFQATLGHYGLN